MHRVTNRFASVSALLSASLLGCGGIAVFEEPGSGGQDASSAASTTNVTSTATGSGPCTSHEQCAPGVCIFTTGECAASCGADLCQGCGPGLQCEPCATSSCPGCKNCVGACVPITEGRCDHDDPCPEGRACDYVGRVCHTTCDAKDDCSDFEYCDQCGASSCCGCLDCVAVCLGGR